MTLILHFGEISGTSVSTLIHVGKDLRRNILTIEITSCDDCRYCREVLSESTGA